MNAHLFIAENASGETALFFGTGSDDRHCIEVDLGGQAREPIAIRKALWEALAASPLVEDGE